MDSLHQVAQWYWNPSQGYRIVLLITNFEGHRPDEWWLQGRPADGPEEGDIVKETQLDMLLEYQKYGLYQVNWIDRLFGKLEAIIPLSWKKRMKKQEVWSNEGVFEGQFILDKGDDQE